MLVSPRFVRNLAVSVTRRNVLFHLAGAYAVRSVVRVEAENDDPAGIQPCLVEAELCGKCARGVLQSDSSAFTVRARPFQRLVLEGDVVAAFKQNRLEADAAVEEDAVLVNKLRFCQSITQRRSGAVPISRAETLLSCRCRIRSSKNGAIRLGDRVPVVPLADPCRGTEVPGNEPF